MGPGAHQVLQDECQGGLSPDSGLLSVSQQQGHMCNQLLRHDNWVLVTIEEVMMLPQQDAMQLHELDVLSPVWPKPRTPYWGT